MALDVQAIREAIATRLSDRCGVTAYPFDVSSVVYPRMIVMPGSPFISYHETLGNGLVELAFEIEVRATATDPIGGQLALCPFLNAGTLQDRSVLTALEEVATGDTTPTLGGAVENIVVTNVFTPPGVQLVEGPYEFTATFSVAVRARRN